MRPLKKVYDYCRFQLMVVKGEVLFKFYNRNEHKNETHSYGTIDDIREDIRRGKPLNMICHQFEYFLGECVFYVQFCGFDFNGEFCETGRDAYIPGYQFMNMLRVFRGLCRNLGAKE